MELYVTTIYTYVPIILKCFSLQLGTFERVRYYLKKYKLIKNGPTSFDQTLCGESGDSLAERCTIGYTTHSCAIRVSCPVMR